MFLVQICFKSRLKQDFFTLKEYKQLFSLPRNSRWRPKGDFEGQIYISIFKVKATVFSLLSCIFALLNSQRLICGMLRLFPSSERHKPKFSALSWWTFEQRFCALFSKEKGDWVPVHSFEFCAGGLEKILNLSKLFTFGRESETRNVVLCWISWTD